MKTMTIESIIALFHEETATAYAQIINTAVNCNSRSELREAIKRLKTETEAHNHFEWGFGRNHFWLVQRNCYQSSELFDNRMLIVRF